MTVRRRREIERGEERRPTFAKASCNPKPIPFNVNTETKIG
jgi:hypothetical protein